MWKGTHQCRQVWRSEGNVGVSFLSGSPLWPSLNLTNLSRLN